jgi:hypothetical protein
MLACDGWCDLVFVVWAYGENVIGL